MLSKKQKCAHHDRYLPAYWREKNIIKASTQRYGRSFDIFIQIRDIFSILRNEKVLTYDRQCSIYFTSCQNIKYIKRVLEWYLVCFPFFCKSTGKEVMKNFSYRDSLGPLSEKYSLQQAGIILISPVTLLENTVLSRKSQWKLFSSSNINGF